MARRKKHPIGKGIVLSLVNEEDFFVELEDGTRIARRVRDGEGGGYWQSLHPNYVVTQSADYNEIEVAYTADQGKA